MKPSQLKKGDKLSIKSTSGERTAFFICRIPAQAGQKAVNLLRFPSYAGVNGSDDTGTCEMSDYDISRRAEYA